MSPTLPEGLCQDRIKTAGNCLFLIPSTSVLLVLFAPLRTKNNSNVAHGWERYEAPGYELHQTGPKKHAC